MGLTRLLALVRKEFLALFRDPKSRMILIAPPVLQLLVFSYAATLEVRNVDVMVFNLDAGHWGSELTSRIEALAAVPSRSADRQSGRASRCDRPRARDRRRRDRSGLLPQHRGGHHSGCRHHSRWPPAPMPRRLSRATFHRSWRGLPPTPRPASGSHPFGSVPPPATGSTLTLSSRGSWCPASLRRLPCWSACWSRRWPSPGNVSWAPSTS